MVVLERVKERWPAQLGYINVSEFVEGNHQPTHHTSHPSVLISSTPTSKMSSHNNFTGMGFDYLYAEDESYIDPDAPIAGPSRSQDWYLNPPPEGYAEQSGYEGSTLLDASGDQFVDPHAGYPDAFGNSEAGELFCY